MTAEAVDGVSDNRAEIAGIFARGAPTFDQVGPRSFADHGRRLVETAGVGIPQRRDARIVTGRRPEW